MVPEGEGRRRRVDQCQCYAGTKRENHSREVCQCTGVKMGEICTHANARTQKDRRSRTATSARAAAADVAAGRGTATAVTISRSAARPQGSLITPIPWLPHHPFRMLAKPNTGVPPRTMLQLRCYRGLKVATGMLVMARRRSTAQGRLGGLWGWYARADVSPCDFFNRAIDLVLERKGETSEDWTVSEATSVASTLWMQHGLCQVTSH